MQFLVRTAMMIKTMPTEDESALMTDDEMDRIEAEVASRLDRAVQRAAYVLNGEVEHLKEHAAFYSFEPSIPNWITVRGAVNKESVRKKTNMRLFVVFPEWFHSDVAHTTQFEELQKELRHLVDSWVDNGWCLDTWSEKDRLKRFVATLHLLFSQEPYRQEELAPGFTIDICIPKISVADRATWLFYDLITHFDCRNLGKCGNRKCGKYCFRNRCGNFFCDDDCSRYEHALVANKKTWKEGVDRKIGILKAEADRLNERKKPWESEKEWRSKLLDKALTQDPSMTKKFVTQHRDELPKSRLKTPQKVGE